MSSFLVICLTWNLARQVLDKFFTSVEYKNNFSARTIKIYELQRHYYN